MNSGQRTLRILLPTAALMIVAGCGGGGGGSNSGSQVTTVNNPPNVSFTGVTPNDSTLVRFQPYTFSATGSDPDIGDSITGFEWDFGDGTILKTTTGSAQHVYTTSGSFSFKVRAYDTHGATSDWSKASATVLVDSSPSPITISNSSLTQDVSVSTQLAGSVNLNISFTITDQGTGTISPSGVVLSVDDPTVTVGTPVLNQDGTWGVLLTLPASSTAGSRTITPILRVTDSLGISSDPTTLKKITVNTYSTTILPPATTLVATPKIVAGQNATWQGVAVDFVATATDPQGAQLSYSWDFGDGGSGNVASTQDVAALKQTHTFASPGVYTVNFVADNGLPGGKKTTTLALNILANAAPVLAVAQAPAGDPYANVPVVFTSNVTDANGDPVTVSWNFGDNSPVVTGSLVTHSFLSSGQTVVTATADDGKGGIAKWTQVLTVKANQPPVCSVTTAAATLYQNKSYAFTASGTDPDSASGDSIVAYEWDFGDGTDLVRSTTTSQSHTYASTFAGTAAVKVRGIDSHGAVGVFSPAVNFTVQATQLPVVKFLTPAIAATYNTEVGAASGVAVTYIVQVTNPNGASGTYLPLNSLIFSAGENVTATGTSNGDGTYTYVARYAAAASTGSRLVAPTPSVTATDGIGISSVVTSSPAITINTQAKNDPPVITFASAPSIPAATNNTWQGVPIVFNGTATDPNGDALTYTINFGDGTTVAKTPVGTNGQIQANHTYAAAGTYSAVLSVDDGRTNGVKTVTLNMVIQANAAPTVSVVWADPKGNISPVNTYANVPLTFTATSADANGDAVTLTWDFGDGSTKVTGAGPMTHTFAAAGSTKIVVTADDGKGNAGTTPAWTQTLNVQANNTPVSKVTTAAGALLLSKQYSFAASATDPDAGDTVVQYEWDFGDGSATSLTTVPTANHTYASVGNYKARVRGIDNHGAVGDYSPSVTFNVQTSANPVAAFVTPSGASTLSLGTGNTITQDFVFSVTNPNIALGATDPLPVSGITFNPGDSNGTLLNLVSLGSGSYKASVRYAAAATPGSRIAVPTILVQDSLGIPNTPTAVQGSNLTLVTGTFGIPVINVSTPSTSAYTLASVPLNFAVTNPSGNPTTYTVNWGDGTTDTNVLTGASLTSGASVGLTHAYQTAGTFNVTINATDGRSANNAAAQQARTFTISTNQMPTVSIDSPQSSATLPGSLSYQIPATPVFTLATNPHVVVIPAGGKLLFAGTSQGPSSGTYSTQWTFNGGYPSAFSGDAPGEVRFDGDGANVVAYYVTYVVTDQFNRTATDYKWVVVDGANTQKFNLSFMYRQKQDNNGNASITPVLTAANGLGAQVKIFQDGVTNTYAVSDGQGMANASIPVRSSLGFYIKIPGIGSDTNSYMIRIPNAPSGATGDPAGGKYVDTSLGTTLDPSATTSNFGFASTTTAPWNPTLKIVTAQGFTPETESANLRTIYGQTSLYGATTPLNERWLSRVSVPMNDALTSPFPGGWAWSSNTTVTNTGGFTAYQNFADWPIMLRTLATSDNTTPGTSSDLKFKLDYETYKDPLTLSKSFAPDAMQAFRVPKMAGSPYDMDTANWGRASALASLNPTSSTANVRAFLFNSAYSAQASGGLQGLSIPYSPTDTLDRVVQASATTRNFSNIAQTFSYSEYLWTKVWSWPLVLNTAMLNSSDTNSLNGYTHFRYSSPAAWPKVASISVTDSSNFDLTANGGADFLPANSMVGDATTPASSTGTGHFYWTIYSPFYASSGASLVARTWLAQGTSDSYPGQMPTTYSATGTDSKAAFGFVPPQDVVVDKRTRNSDGSLNTSDSNLNGYRVNWFNPTVDTTGAPVPPDFWVVELNVPSSGKSQFVLPGNYPSSYVGATVDPSTMSILTDARTSLVHPSDGTALANQTVVAPGYCWFDVPVELRPAKGTVGTTVTVYALRSVLNNHAPAGARALNRLEWIEAIKTASANISVKTNGGTDLSNIYKIPFNYYWDIVITNGPITTVAQ